MVRLPGESRAAQIAAFDGLVPRARAAVGRPRRVVRRRLGGPAPRLPRGALDARGAAEGGRRPARLARGAAPAAEEALQGRAAAPGRRAPVRRRRPRPAQRARLGRAGRLPRAALRRLDRRGRHGRARDRADGPAGDPAGRRSRRGVAVEDVVVRDGRAVGVRTSAGVVDADAVVVAVDPRLLPALASYVERTMPSMPPVVCHVGLEGELPEHLASMPHETVLHGDPMLVVRTGGTAPPGHAAWTVHGRGPAGRGHPARPGPARHRPAAARRRAGRPHPARDGRALGQLAARRALAGPGDGPAPARPGDPGQRACTPRARTPPPAAACRSSGCRPRSSRRRSARREFHRVPGETHAPR